MPRKRTILMGNLIDSFLSHKQANSKPATYDLYARFLNEFRTRHSSTAAEAMTANILRGWIEKHYGRDASSTRRFAARAVLAVLHHAYMEQIIDRKPIRGFQKAADGRREIIITPAQYAKCVKASPDPAIRTMLKFLWHTGVRPAEFRLLHSSWVRGRKILLPEDVAKTKRRTIYLGDMSHRIVSQIVARRSGVIFRDPSGKEWTKHGLTYRFRVLRDDTGIPGLMPYAFRHTWITRMLEKGIDVASVAELARTSPKMILEVYNHVVQNEPRLLSLLD